MLVANVELGAERLLLGGGNGTLDSQDSRKVYTMLINIG